MLLLLLLSFTCSSSITWWRYYHSWWREVCVVDSCWVRCPSEKRLFEPTTCTSRRRDFLFRLVCICQSHHKGVSSVETNTPMIIMYTQTMHFTQQQESLIYFSTGISSKRTPFEFFGIFWIFWIPSVWKKYRKIIKTTNKISRIVCEYMFKNMYHETFL